jgi:hypothetical protein
VTLRIRQRVSDGKLRYFVQRRRFWAWRDVNPVGLDTFGAAVEVQLALRADQNGGVRPWLQSFSL